jgi:hypothetical protein
VGQLVGSSVELTVGNPLISHLHRNSLWGSRRLLLEQTMNWLIIRKT